MTRPTRGQADFVATRLMLPAAAYEISPQALNEAIQLIGPELRSLQSLLLRVTIEEYAQRQLPFFESSSPPAVLHLVGKPGLGKTRSIEQLLPPKPFSSTGERL